MNSTALQECLSALACPTCNGRLLLTQERVLFCASCLMGYPLSGDVPDFRATQSIDFKKLAAGSKPVKSAVLSVQPGKSLKERIELARGHCVVVGRSLRQDPDSDITYVGFGDGGVIQLNEQLRQLVEKFLSLPASASQDGKLAHHDTIMPVHPLQSFGSFRRVPDVFLDDRSVSRAHALFYHDRDGLWVVDLVSKNGTHLNGREVERTGLKSGDVVSLGAVGIGIYL